MAVKGISPATLPSIAYFFLEMAERHAEAGAALRYRAERGTEAEHLGHWRLGVDDASTRLVLHAGNNTTALRNLTHGVTDEFRRTDNIYCHDRLKERRVCGRAHLVKSLCRGSFKGKGRRSKLVVVNIFKRDGNVRTRVAVLYARSEAVRD